MCLSTTPSLLGLPHPNSLIGKFNNDVNDSIKDRNCVVQFVVLTGVNMTTLAAGVALVAYSALKASVVLVCSPALLLFSSGRPLIGRALLEVPSALAITIRSIVLLIGIPFSCYVAIISSGRSLQDFSPLDVAKAIVPNSVSDYLSTHSVYGYDANTIRTFIEYGASLKRCPDFVKDELLRKFVDAQDLELISLLIKEGIDLNKTAIDGKHLLFYAFEKDLSKVEKFLTENGINVTQTDSLGNLSILEGFCCGDRSASLITLSRLLTKFPEININHQNHFGERFLDKFLTQKIPYYMEKDLSDYIIYLIGKGAEANYKTKSGASPLDRYVSKRGYSAEGTIIKMLAMAGADFTRSLGDFWAKRAINEIIEPEVNKYLPNPLNKDTFIYPENLRRPCLPQYLEAYFREAYNKKIAPYVVEAEIGKFLPDDLKSTGPIQRNKLPEPIEKLFQEKVQDIFWDSTWFHSFNSIKMERAIRLGADVNKLHPWRDYRAIHVAVHCDNLEAVKLLITLGADVNLKTNHDETPLDLATNPSIIATLKSHGAKGKTSSRREEDPFASYSSSSAKSDEFEDLFSSFKSRFNSNRSGSSSLFASREASPVEKAFQYFDSLKEEGAPSLRSFKGEDLKTAVGKVFKRLSVTKVKHPDLGGSETDYKDLVHHRDKLIESLG